MPTNTNPPMWAMRTQADHKAISEGCYFDAREANKIVNFANTLFQPQYMRTKFKLTQFQSETLQSLWGWRNADGSRRFRFANLHMAKKNGKTLLAAICCAYEILMSGEPSAFALSCSVSRDNASQIFSEIIHSLKRSPFADWIDDTPTQKRIKIESLNSQFVAVSSDASRIPGYNLSLAVADECGWMKNLDLLNQIRYAGVDRPNFLCLVISTASYPAHPYFDIVDKSKKILSGDNLDTTWYASVHESAGDPEDPAEWRKANPLLGLPGCRTEASFKRDMESARSTTNDWLNWQRLCLNKFMRADEFAWLETSDFPKYRIDMTDDELKQYPSVLGIDASTSIDPTSISQVFVLPNRRYHVRCFSWVAREGAIKRQRSNMPLYESFQSEGSMTITEGNRIDDVLIKEKVLELLRDYNITQTNFDASSGSFLMMDLQNQGFQVATFPQTPTYYNSPMLEFEKAFGSGRISYDGQNTWLKYCLSNVRLKSTHSNLIAPSRKSSLDKIDAGISTLLAFMTAMQIDGESGSIFFV